MKVNKLIVFKKSFPPCSNVRIVLYRWWRMKTVWFRIFTMESVTSRNQNRAAPLFITKYKAFPLHSPTFTANAVRKLRVGHLMLTHSLCIAFSENISILLFVCWRFLVFLFSAGFNVKTFGNVPLIWKINSSLKLFSRVIYLVLLVHFRLIFFVLYLIMLILILYIIIMFTNLLSRALNFDESSWFITLLANWKEQCYIMDRSYSIHAYTSLKLCALLIDNIVISPGGSVH